MSPRSSFSVSANAVCGWASEAGIRTLHVRMCNWVTRWMDVCVANTEDQLMSLFHPFFQVVESRETGIDCEENVNCWTYIFALTDEDEVCSSKKCCQKCLLKKDRSWTLIQVESSSYSHQPSMPRPPMSQGTPVITPAQPKNALPPSARWQQQPAPSSQLSTEEQEFTQVGIQNFIVNEVWDKKNIWYTKGV